MSKIALTPNASGTGTFTIAAPNSNTNRTLTLPDATGILFSDADVASQAAAEAGTGTGLMTSERTAQAISAQRVRGNSALVTLSGSSVDFTDIPATARRVTVMVSGLSTNGTTVPLVQLGDAGGIEASGYLGGIGFAGASSNSAALSVGVSFVTTMTAAIVLHGKVTFDLMNEETNLWSFDATWGRTDGIVYLVGGTKSLSETLTQLRLTTNSANVFDAGTASISWE